MENENISFEEALSQLEKTVARLESGECSLEESIALFEKGMKNINECRKVLKIAELKITKLCGGETENVEDA